MKNVLFLPLQPADRLTDLLNAADIQLLPQRADAEDMANPEAGDMMTQAVFGSGEAM